MFVKIIKMVSFLFGKRRRSPANRRRKALSNLPGYSLGDYTNRIELGPGLVPASDLDFGKRRRMTRRRASPACRCA